MNEHEELSKTSFDNQATSIQSEPNPTAYQQINTQIPNLYYNKILPFIQALQDVSNLDTNQAKTLVYYLIITNSDKPKIRPIVDNHGESGVGKTVIQRQLQSWSPDGKWINARNKTSAQLRDDLADKRVVFIEEADKTKEPKECENWIQNRYDESGRGMTYKMPPTYRTERHDHTGYTILHTQNAFESIELDRRIIRINVVKDSTKKYHSTEGLDCTILKDIADDIDWDKDIPQNFSNSAVDAWLPLIRVADYLGDVEFIAYANQQVESKRKEDDLTKVYESSGIVLSEIIPLYTSTVQSNKPHIPITSIRLKLKERGYDYTERKIVKEAKDMGFTIVYPSNKALYCSPLRQRAG